MFGEVGFQPPRQFAPRQQDSPSAGFTFQADIGAQAHNGPFIPAAWMRLAQAKHIVQTKISQHSTIHDSSFIIPRNYTAAPRHADCDKLTITHISIPEGCHAETRNVCRRDRRH
jgi:hypothetical protein